MVDQSEVKAVTDLSSEILESVDLENLNEEDPNAIDIFDSEAMAARSKKWREGDFSVKLALEKEYQLRTGRPFIIWRKEENKPTPQNPHSRMELKPFVQHLDHSHSTMDVIIRYYKEGMRIAFHHIPEAPDEEREQILSAIRDYCNSRDREMAQLRKEIMAELGLNAKIKKEQEALKNGKR